MAIRRAKPGDEHDVLRMRRELWPDCSEEDHARELAAYVAGAARSPAGPSALWVATRPEGGLCGFVEAGFRSYAEGCEDAPVPCVEALFVDADQRRRGVGRALLHAVETWAGEHGANELASDTGLENEAALRAHLALGFEEVERTVHLRKALAGTRATRPIRRGQLGADIPAALPSELVTVLADGVTRIERIVSHGHASPPSFWYDQDEDEWVTLVTGAARLEIVDGETVRTLELAPGDWLDLPRHCRHRVAWTTPDADTVWLAVFRRT